MNRAVAAIELAAAGFFAVSTLLTFLSVVLRYLFALPLPDGFDLSRLLLGIVILWGIAAASWHGDHIRMEILRGLLGPRGQRVLDILALAVAFAFMALFAWMLGDKVLSTRAAGEETFDLRLAVWPFYLVAWFGVAAAALLLLARTVRRLVGDD